MVKQTDVKDKYRNIKPNYVDKGCVELTESKLETITCGSLGL